jgi:hypothetical protein
VELDVNPDMIRQSPHVQVGLLEAVEVPRVAQDHIEVVRVVLDGGVKLDAAQLSQAEPRTGGPN